MPGFRYQAYSVEGKLHKGVLEADSARQARSLLRDQGLTPYRVEVIAANDPAAGARFRPVALSPTEITQMTRGLASLLEAGLTVEQAFNALIEQAENERARQVLAALRGEVLAGNTIAKSLASFPKAFPELYRTLFLKRNADWLPQVEAFIRSPETELILVGVAHLAGADGLVETLRRRGFEVVQVK